MPGKSINRRNQGLDINWKRSREQSIVGKTEKDEW